MSSPWGDVEYHIETPAQFWDELDDTLRLPKRPTLEQLDASLLTYTTLSAAYLDEYLNSEQLLDHAIQLVLKSVLFKFHSQRMVDLLLRQARSREASPCENYFVMSCLLVYGHHTPQLYRGLSKWRPIMQRLLNPLRPPDQRVGDIEGEERLRSLVARLIYEICRVQKLEEKDLDLFDDDLIDHLFELVETTRGLEDESLNYGVIRLLIALNEQFMVATLTPSAHHPHTHSHEHHSNGHHSHQEHRRPSIQHATTHSAVTQTDKGVPETPSEAKGQNRVLVVLMRRLGASKTFGENMIFMLNRAENTPEDLCLQLLILKILYLLFTTPGTSEYFYTNDLKVLVDVFIRALSDLPEESESLRHTYLRVLHPLLTSTQLRSSPYKRPHLLRVLRSTTYNPHGIREVSPTTKRLVERCLSGAWCSEGTGDGPPGSGQQGSLGTMKDVAGTLGVDAQVQGEEGELAEQDAGEKGVNLSRSLDNLKLASPSDLPGKRQSSLPSVASHLAPPSSRFYTHDNSTAPQLSVPANSPPTEHAAPSSAPDNPSPLSLTVNGKSSGAQRRKPPPPPVNRLTKARPLGTVLASREVEVAGSRDGSGWQTFR